MTHVLIRTPRILSAIVAGVVLITISTGARSAGKSYRHGSLAQEL